MSYPSSICAECGEIYGNSGLSAKNLSMATWTVMPCDLCGCNVPCTEPRDFGHLFQGWEKGCKHPRYQSENGKHICQTCGQDVTALAIERDGLTVAFLSDQQCGDSRKGQTHA